jgi:parallel beta-helix repeat protein
MVGREDFQPNRITITGNILSDTETHIHLRHVSDVAISGNTFFTTEPTDLLIEQSSRVTVAASVFNPRESSGTGQIVLRNSRECLLSGLAMRDLRAGRAAVSMTGCRDCRIGDCIISGSRNGVWMENCESCVMADCTVTRLPEDGRPLVEKSSDGSAALDRADS